VEVGLIQTPEKSTEWQSGDLRADRPDFSSLNPAIAEKLQVLAREKNFNLAENLSKCLTYALFPDAGLKFLENRGNPAASAVPKRAKARDYILGSRLPPM